MELTFKGIKYRIDESFWVGDLLNTSAQFQFEQLQYCIEKKEWIALENRINGMLKWGGIKKL